MSLGTAGLAAEVPARRWGGGRGFFAGLVVAALTLGVLLAWSGAGSPARGMRVEWVSSEPSGMVDATRGEPRLLTLRVVHGDERRPDPLDWVHFKNEGKTVVARAGGSWHPVSDTFNLRMLRRGDSQEITVLVPPDTERCVIEVLGAWTPWKWRWAGRIRPVVDRLPGPLRTWIWSPPRGGLIWREVHMEATRPGLSPPAREAGGHGP